MHILLIGSGGREHALAWKLAQSPTCTRLSAAPGNPGIASHAALVALDVADAGAVIDWCRTEAVGLVVVGPEAPLCDGLGDRLRAAGIAVFGPDAAAARLEGSKAFTKALCARANIPTAAWVRCGDAAEGIAALDRFGLPVVIKADGLAAGKGVVIAETRSEAETAVREATEDGHPIVIEEFMSGEEASLFALSDGRDVVAFGSAQDHKRVGDGDIGPNTGGMGAYSPAPVLTPALEARAMAEIVEPTVAALAAAGTPYVGVLYAGLMLTAEGPKLVEYNCRFGDPECQVLMPRFDGDFAALALAVANGRLKDFGPVRFYGETTLTVVMAAKGYPGTPLRGGTIDLRDAESKGAIIFHAGTTEREGKLVSNGGRVLAVTATGESVAEAQERAYAGVDRIIFEDGFCRRDIGWREVAREKEQSEEQG
jgi:phosphoribosylamine---glycine ligase